MPIFHPTEDERIRIQPRLLARSRANTGNIGQERLRELSRNRISPSSVDDGTTCVTVGVISMAIFALLTLFLLLSATYLNPDFLMISIAPN